MITQLRLETLSSMILRNHDRLSDYARPFLLSDLFRAAQAAVL